MLGLGMLLLVLFSMCNKLPVPLLVLTLSMLAVLSGKCLDLLPWIHFQNLNLDIEVPWTTDSSVFTNVKALFPA